ncbi:hypothetical protein VE03_09694 [Pseudogymnoascus sp. 23342-1-I1]|nr:hypothetical protein VE03_09694 [Pseudogymnoascus sp. 23342-1-I1]
MFVLRAFIIVLTTGSDFIIGWSGFTSLPDHFRGYFANSIECYLWRWCSSKALTGAATIIGYVAGSPYVASLSACSAQCLATAACTNIYFIQGSNCNLHSGSDAFNKGVGTPLFQFYDRSCFTCSTASATTAPPSTACRTISGVISPTPSGATCGASGASTPLTGAGTIIGYGSSSIYATSLAACSAQCLATATCTNIYFIKGSYCNLHYGPDSFLEGAGNPQFAFYDVSCFTCPQTLVPTTSVSTSISSTLTTTSFPTATGCTTVSGIASPTPTGAICGGRGSSHAVTGAGTLIGYGTGTPYVASLAACSAKCLATSCCTNIYFIQGSYCNLHYGPNALLPGAGNPLFDYYDASCFTCDRLSCSTSSYNMALTTTFTPPAKCTQETLTQMAYSSNGIWDNAIIPVPTSTVTSCYPTQFADSVIASAVYSTILPPFAELVCPYNWEASYFNSTYLICCPPNFNLFLPNESNANRPGLNATCTSHIYANALMDITSYDSTAYATVIATSAPAYGVLVFANAFDGTALHPQATTTGS